MVLTLSGITNPFRRYTRANTKRSQEDINKLASFSKDKNEKLGVITAKLDSVIYGNIMKLNDLKETASNERDVMKAEVWWWYLYTVPVRDVNTLAIMQASRSEALALWLVI